MKLTETGKRRVVRWERYEVCSGEIYMIVGVNPEGKTPLGTPRRRWQNNNQMGFEDTTWWCGLEFCEN